MNPAMKLIGVYVVVTFLLQATFLLISKLIDQVTPDWSLLAFLILFMCAYWLAWPVAVRLTEPKAVESALQADLITLQRQGLIGRFSVEHRRDGPVVQVTAGTNSPPDLRAVLVDALGHSVSERRITIAV